MTTTSQELAHYIQHLEISDLPQEIIEHTKMCILDWIGAALPGIKQKHVLMLMETLVASGGKPECTLIGYGKKTSCLNAALINGTTSYAVKLDQTSPYGSLIHPQPAMIPAAFAVAEWKGLSGSDFILAVLLGFEIEVRVAMTVNPSSMEERGFQTTGTCGTFGAATAAGKLMRLNEEQMVHALGIAGNQAAGLVGSSATPARPLLAGKAAYNGILATMLAKKGFKGAEDVFEGKGGFCHAMANRYDLSKLTDGLDHQFHITDQRFVRYSVAGAMHAAIDAVIELTKTHGIRAEDIDLIDARTHPVAETLCGLQEPKTFSEVQFSLPFCLAIAAIYGQVSLGQMTKKKLWDPKVVALAKKVKGSVDPEFSAHGFSGRKDHFQSAKVTITTRDGKKFYQKVDAPKGSPQNPFTKEELLEKFRPLASMVLTKPKVEAIIRVIGNLETLDSVKKLARLMRP